MVLDITFHKMYYRGNKIGNKTFYTIKNTI